LTFITSYDRGLEVPRCYTLGLSINNLFPVSKPEAFECQHDVTVYGLFSRVLCMLLQQQYKVVKLLGGGS
jgi:hypothetical protein